MSRPSLAPKRNLDIRAKAIENNIALWEIAEKLEITSNYLSVILRKELSAEKKERIFNIISEILRERKEN